MKYLEGTKILCLERAEYVREGVCTEVNFRQQKAREEITVHGTGSDALIEYESLPPKYRAIVFAKYGNPYEYAAREPLRRLVIEDQKARQFFADYILHTGEHLPLKYQRDYSRQCDYLNLVGWVKEDPSEFKRMLNTSLGNIWQIIIQLAKADKVHHRLPLSTKRLFEKHAKYVVEGYESVVELHRFGNQYARVVTDEIENLILAIYAQYDGRTTITQACKDYNDFVLGRKHLVNLETGELYDPAAFLVKGKVHQIELSTIAYYINKKKNREKIDLMKLGRMDYAQKHMPHNRRISAQYAMSKISMDDYLPPFKTLDGKRTVWMYVIFDVASTAIVGVSYGTQKKVALVNEAFRNMFQNLVKYNLGFPFEIELERHLNFDRRGSQEHPDIFTEGHVFPFVSFETNNPQAKRAERFLGSFKYEELIRLKGFLGRPHGRNENFKYNSDAPEHWRTAKDLIADLQKSVSEYNAQEYKDGLSRWEWMCQNVHPEAIQNPIHTIIPYIGDRTETSVHRTLVQVKNNLYQVPTGLDWAGDIAGRKKVDAYSLPVENSAVNEVYLFDKMTGKYLCTAPLADRYHEAKVERTAEDWAIMQRQSQLQKDFLNGAKEGLVEIPKVEIMENEKLKVENEKWLIDQQSMVRQAHHDIRQAHHDDRPQATDDRLFTVRKGYDKLAQETEEYELVGGQQTADSGQNTTEATDKMHKKPLKEGGYVQNFDTKEIITHAISSL